MIDWFPTTPRMDSDAAVGELTRWRGVANLCRVSRGVDALGQATDGHSDRVAELAVGIAVQLGWRARRVVRLREAARIHDIGKACVPEDILLAPRRLTPEEYEIVKEHAVLGAVIAATVLAPAQVAWVRSHHERWDGRGYPDGLCETEIPEGAAILCVADAWDAMTHRSWTGNALSRSQALGECRRKAGLQFAPHVVDALLRVLTARRDGWRGSRTRLRLVTAA